MLNPAPKEIKLQMGYDVGRWGQGDGDMAVFTLFIGGRPIFLTREEARMIYEALKTFNL